MTCKDLSNSTRGGSLIFKDLPKSSHHSVAFKDFSILLYCFLISEKPCSLTHGSLTFKGLPNPGDSRISGLPRLWAMEIPGFWGTHPFGIWEFRVFCACTPMGCGDSEVTGSHPIGMWGFWGYGVPPLWDVGCSAPCPPPLPPIPQAVERVLFPHLPSYGASLHAVLDDNSVSNAQVKADGHKVYGAILVSDPPLPMRWDHPALWGSSGHWDPSF